MEGLIYVLNWFYSITIKVYWHINTLVITHYFCDHHVATFNSLIIYYGEGLLDGKQESTLREYLAVFVFPIALISVPVFPDIGMISEISRSIGVRSSYKLGACKIIPAVPTHTANVNIHRNNRSSTMATYFQSSFTCKCNIRKIEYTQDEWNQRRSCLKVFWYY